MEPALTRGLNLKPIPIDWSNIQTVFLDMDGTLLDLHFDNHFWLEHMPFQYAQKHGLSLDKAKTELANMCSSIEGTLDWYCLDYWEEKLDMDIVALKTQVSNRIAVRNNVETFLKYLADQQCRVVLLTNAHRKTVALKFAYTSIEPYFDRVITSHDIGVAKEDDNFWNKLHTIEYFNPKQSLFIDDNLDVLQAAENHGVAHLLAIHQPDSQQAPKNTQHYTAIECFKQLIH
ncbi:MAG: GMP/IMP nucleotidase [Thiotrichaceae bacterium]